MNAGFSFQQQAATRCVEGDAMLDLQVAQAREYVGQLLLPLPNHLQGLRSYNRRSQGRAAELSPQAAASFPLVSPFAPSACAEQPASNIQSFNIGTRGETCQQGTNLQRQPPATTGFLSRARQFRRCLRRRQVAPTRVRSKWNQTRTRWAARWKE